VVDAVRSAGGTAHFEHADLRDTGALRTAVANIRAALGPITVLLNNAAHDQRHKTEEVTPEYFDERIAVNLKHQFFASQAVLPDMQAAGGGSIVCFGSNSWMLGIGGMAVYTASKSAVHGLARSLARDYGPFNIRVNVLVPGWIMTQRQLDNWLTPEADKEREEGQCLKRRLVPDDVARLALFLGSDASDGMTAQSCIIDGGWL
jgi:NAD(P)-dependent dehydrogenase (short-subunit alcohol dehydrogenase family)